MCVVALLAPLLLATPAFADSGTIYDSGAGTDTDADTAVPSEPSWSAADLAGDQGGAEGCAVVGSGGMAATLVVFGLLTLRRR